MNDEIIIPSKASLANIRRLTGISKPTLIKYYRGEKVSLANKLLIITAEEMIKNATS